MKTKEQVAKYNKEYFLRPEVIEKEKIKNARSEMKMARKKYKQTEAGKKANAKYLAKPTTKLLRKNQRMMKRYGIDMNDYEKLYREQKGKCAICGIKKEKLDIDHCHFTNEIRGLLCGSCNRALGLMKDNIDFFNKAIKYLIK